MQPTPYFPSNTSPFSAWVDEEARRQQNSLQLIASENYTSAAVRALQGSVLTNKYAEGYPGKRYYAGCEVMDEVEAYTQHLAKTLFNAEYANVQPHSGSQANQAAFLALLNPGDTILGMGLSEGGHLTHGHKVNLSGKWFNAVSYGINGEGLLDMDSVRQLALKHRPRMIIAGASAYSRVIDWAAFRRIADEVGAVLLADMAHYAGLIAAGLYPSPVPHAHVTTSTTHKGLRGPRGGLILTNDEGLAKKINTALFPGLQGGPLMHVIAAKWQSFWEALQPEFHSYQLQVLLNNRTMADVFIKAGVPLISGGTDSHLCLMDLQSWDLSGHDVETFWAKHGVITNKNSVPKDPRPPAQTSGVRVGTNAITTRGLQEQDAEDLAVAMMESLQAFRRKGDHECDPLKNVVLRLTQAYPLE